MVQLCFVNIYLQIQEITMAYSPINMTSVNQIFYCFQDNTCRNCKARYSYPYPIIMKSGSNEKEYNKYSLENIIFLIKRVHY